MWTFADRRLLHTDASAASVAIARIWVFGIWAVLVGTSPDQGLAMLPGDAFSPLGFLAYLPESAVAALRSREGLVVLRALVSTACAAAALGFLARPAALVAAAGILIHQGVARSFAGYVNHAELPLMLGAMILAVAPIDRSLVIWPRPLRNDRPAAYQATLLALLLVTCLPYLFIAAYRMGIGGTAVFRSDSLEQWMLEWSLMRPDPDSGLGARWIASPLLGPLTKYMLAPVTLLELSAPLAILNRRYRLFFVPGMLLVHTGIWLLMSISFLEHALMYLFFLDSRRWSPLRSLPHSQAVVYFDGFCGLCNRFVDFLLVRDRARRLRLAPIQGRTAGGRFDAPDSPDPAAIVFEEGPRVLDRSTAALQALGRLGGAWPLATVLGVIPVRLRDAVYDWVAENRYRWFGRRETCRLPGPGEADAFLP